MFCKRRVEKMRTFHVGYHQVPDWVREELGDEVVVIRVTSRGSSPKITVQCSKFTAEEGDWIVDDHGFWLKYSDKDFQKIFETIDEDN